MNRALLVEGSFGPVSVDDVLEVVSMSRQCMEIVFDGTSGRSLVVKAGRVLSATATPDEGLEAFRSLYARPGRTFAVYRRDGTASAAPIGTLSELVAEARRNPRKVAPPERVVILEGSFADHPFGDVLDVASLSRQRIELTTRRSDGTTGVIVAKAGKILEAADSRGPVGREALGAIAADPGDAFVLAYLGRATVDNTPIGSLASLVDAKSEPKPKPSAPRKILIEGTFARFPVLGVLATLALSRQTVELVTFDDRGARGRLVVRSGQVLDVAVSGTKATGMSAFAELVARPGTRFSAAVAERTMGDPIGALTQWVSALPKVVPLPPTHTVMEGTFDTWNLRQVLDVTSVSRQLMVVTLFRDNRPRGKVVAKSGMIVDAETADGGTGAAAVRALVAQPGERFVVTLGEQRSLATPIGTIAEITAPEPVEQRVADGDFETFPLENVLAVASLARTTLEIRTSGAKRFGPARLVVKSGRLLAASRGGENDPIRVLCDLLADPGDRFEVVRIAKPSHTPHSIPLDEALEQARALAEESATIVALVDEDPQDLEENPFDSEELTATPMSAPREQAEPPPPPATPAPTSPTTSSRLSPTLVPDDRSATARDEALLQRITALEERVTALAADGVAREVLDLVAAMQRTMEEQDRRIAAANRRRPDTWLVALILVVQATTLAAAVVIALAAWLGQLSGGP